MLPNEMAFYVFIGSTIASTILTTIVIYMLFTEPVTRKDQDDSNETEANAITCSPDTVSNNNSGDKHHNCCCKSTKRANIPAKRPKHPSES